MMRYRSVAVTFAGLFLSFAACSPAEDGSGVGQAAASEATAAEPTLLSVTAGDFFFQTQRTVPAGVTSIQLTNRGPDFHHVQLVKLEDGHTVNELLTWISEHGEQTPEWATLVGGPNAPAPGGSSLATLNLEAGEYALICVIPSADGILHVMKGMVVPLTVTRATEVTTPPTVDTKMVLNDYSFTITPELHAGRQVVEVQNAAEQPHEVFIVRLDEGKAAPDLLTWMENPQGPPPALPLGGATLLSKGQSNYLTLDLTPGEYALYCFVPDANDHAPHFAHGMIRQITVM